MIALGKEQIKYISLGSTEVVKVYLGTEKVYPVEVIDDRDYSKEYMTLDFLEDGTYKQYSASVPTLYYSLNDGDWIKYTSSGVSVKKGDKVRLKSTNTKVIVSNGNPLINSTTPSYNVYGNVNSLYAGDDFETDLSRIYNYQCHAWFKGTKVVDASNLVLPYETLTNYCYRYMFQDCTLLEKAPKVLPATTLGESCYLSMFDGCEKLVTAQKVLPATTLKNYCYQYMFRNCKSLLEAPELPALTVQQQSCYGYMFRYCESLTKAPELPATKLSSSCYEYMFNGCKSLNYIKCLAENPNNSYTNSWVSGVAAEGTFVQSSADGVDWTIGTSGIPTGWVIQGKTEEDVSEGYESIGQQIESPFYVNGATLTPSANKYTYFSDSTNGTTFSRWYNNMDKEYKSKTYLIGSRWSSTDALMSKFKAEKVGGNIASIFNDTPTVGKDTKIKGTVSHAFINSFNYTTQITDASSLYLPYQGTDTFYNNMFSIGNTTEYVIGMKYGPVLTSLGNGRITLLEDMSRLVAFGLYYGGQENKTLSELVKLPNSVGTVYVNKEAEPFLTNDTAWSITYIDMPNLISD